MSRRTLYWAIVVTDGTSTLHYGPFSSIVRAEIWLRCYDRSLSKDASTHIVRLHK